MTDVLTVEVAVPIPLEGTLTYLEYPQRIGSQIKTNNPLERYLEELQRRIKPFRKFNQSPVLAGLMLIFTLNI